VRHEIVDLAEGWTGTDQTVDWVHKLVQESLLDPVVVTEARGIIRFVPERDKDAEIAAVSQYVRTKIRYTSESVETLSTPRYMVDEIRKHGRATGDCDEAVILWLALLRVLGHKVRVKVISQRADRRASHIFGQVLSPTRGWLTDDTIVKRKPLGWCAPARSITQEKTYQMSGTNEIGGCNMKCCQIGRTRCVTADSLTPRRTRLVSRDLAPKTYQLKTQGALWVDKDGELKGVGIIPALTAAAAAAKPLAKLLKKKKKKKSKVAPPPPPPAQSSGGGGAAAMLLPLGLMLLLR